MMIQSSQNFHTDYPDLTRYWRPASKQYAGGDALLTAIQKNWALHETCWIEEYWHAGSRPVKVYYFDLERDGEKMFMPVINNPYVSRLIARFGLEVRPIAERQAEAK
ncbi:MAG: hypothetical protein GYB67_17795 [Chloroflexi bacterium]|nr:hypothetical protein [Chloroflexota bacterium]